MDSNVDFGLSAWSMFGNQKTRDSSPAKCSVKPSSCLLVHELFFFGFSFPDMLLLDRIFTSDRGWSVLRLACLMDYRKDFWLDFTGT